MDSPEMRGIAVRGRISAEYASILTPEALAFVAGLTRQHSDRALELLARRQSVQARYDASEKPHFLPQTRKVREGTWKVAQLPADLLDRRVEITGPTDRKMVINALNSGANVYMADFEDSNCPTWSNLIQGQLNLRDAVRGDCSFVDPKSGKRYQLGPTPATLLVRPRGWHLFEKHVVVDGRPVPGGVFDFALYFFHNAKELLARGSGPYFYLPKMQSHLEARLWNDIFLDAQAALGIPAGTIKATVLIETLPAAFEMDEILFELRQHSAGLNCGRWDYIFSFIKTNRNDPAYVMPDRSEVGMTQHCMKSYTQLLIKTCHRRGVHAMGGMAAHIPIRDNPAANQAVMDKVTSDKLREVTDGHDGTWIAHPALLPYAKKTFDEHMPGPNQLSKMREDVEVTADDLLRVPVGPRTEAGLRMNVYVGIVYLAAWLGGNGCIPVNHLMEDAATAEIGRTQVWQWVKHGATLEPGNQTLTADRFATILAEELDKIRAQVGLKRFESGNYIEAAEMFGHFSTSPELADFLTLAAYDVIVQKDLVQPKM